MLGNVLIQMKLTILLSKYARKLISELKEKLKHLFLLSRRNWRLTCHDNATNSFLIDFHMVGQCGFFSLAMFHALWQG